MKKLILIYLLSTVTLFAQESQKKRADKYFKIASFAKAAEAYSNLLEEGNTTVEVLKKAADSYYYISEFEKAS